MDKTDRSLLSHMQGDASLSVGELANRVGISKSPAGAVSRNSKQTAPSESKSP